MVLEKCAKIGNITTEVASLKLLLETKQSTHAMSDIIPAESEDDMNSSGDDTSETLMMTMEMAPMVKTTEMMPMMMTTEMTLTMMTM